MMDGIQYLGLSIILLGIGFPLYWWIRSGGTCSVKPLIMLGSFVVFSGIILFKIEVITKFTMPFLKLTAAADKANADAGAISQLKGRVEAQSATVDLVAAQANKAKEMSDTVSSQITDARKK